jgi:hypothetical protein
MTLIEITKGKPLTRTNANYQENKNNPEELA